MGGATRRRPDLAEKTNDGTASNLNLSDKTNREMSQRPRLIEFQSTHRFSPFMTREEQNLYKYTMDIDGNGWSRRFHTLMSSISLVLKSTIRPEWYFDRIQPWYHYVPVNVDYTDLFNIMAFFKVTLMAMARTTNSPRRWRLNPRNGPRRTWRWDDMQAYLYRLLLEYNRVMQRDSNNLQQPRLCAY
ncbi:BZ3501_MvSof-1269-A2-R1_C50g00261 [Microbotryum saponariae]|nr:BZ3501_MvSof-1269-A2-R1_C50g00261 [Microbotryum saponariae]